METLQSGRTGPVTVPAESKEPPAATMRQRATTLLWDGDRSLDNHRAGSTYEELYARFLESDDVVVPPAPRITAYVEAVIARYPDDVHRSAVWASPPVNDEASGPIVYLLISFGEAEDVSEYAASPAREHGLICFDPQRECLWP
ncbi:hypothetical protein ABZ434_31955 [Streptomyces sp. NPDC005761]|uniref:hypothetical protein n=1 Tax=unclassified Streptomyces TaxID=2593676 RepID=UPI0033CBEEF9